jgi:predicted short-subunit dehydrogenase-like oxidoreductase (DUF2520 family)
MWDPRMIFLSLSLDNSGLENTAVGIRHADHVAPSIRKTLALTSLTSGCRSVGIVRLRTEATELLFVSLDNCVFVVVGLSDEKTGL